MKKFLVLFALALSLIGKAQAQSPHGLSTGTTSMTVAMTGQTAGGTNFVYVGWCPSNCSSGSTLNSPVTVTDLAGSVYTSVYRTDGAGSGQVFIAPSPNLANNVITVSIPASDSSVVMASQISGLWTPDTAANSGDLIYAVFVGTDAINYLAGANYARLNAGTWWTDEFSTTNLTPTFLHNGVAANPTFSLSFKLNSVAPPQPVSEFQSVTNDCGSVVSCQLSFSQASSPSDVFVVGVREGSLTSTVSVSDSLGSTYKLVASQPQSTDGGQLLLFVAPNSSSGTNTITVSQTVASTLRIVAREYTGISATVDAQLGAQAASGTAPGVNLTATSAGDLVVGLGYSADVEAWNPGAGFIDLDVVGGKFSMEDEVQQTSGPASVSFSLGASDPWAAIGVALRPTTAPNVGLVVSGTALYDDATAILPGPVAVSQLQNPTTTMGIGTITSDANGNLSGSLSVNPNWTDANGNLTFLFGLPMVPNVISYPVPVGEFQHNSTGLTINLVLFKQGALAIKSQTLAVTP